MNRKVICALDTGSLDEAREIVQRLSPWILSYKIGHALTLAYGLDVIERLRDAGAKRIFLDLKFHDIPSVVALAVREAARRGVWMTTLHIAGGRAMMSAAVEEASGFGEEHRPLLMGVSVLTSLDSRALAQDLGVPRDLTEHMTKLSQLAMENDLDGVVSSPREAAAVRAAIGRHGCIVTPGIRLAHGERDDQSRVADARYALDQGADYLVVGRALTGAEDPEARLREFGLVP